MPETTTHDTAHCPECGSPGWDAEERECETCVAIGDLANARIQLAEAIEHEEWSAARNELVYLGEVIETLQAAVDAIDDPDAHNQIVDLLNPAVEQYNAAVQRCSKAGGWR